MSELGRVKNISLEQNLESSRYDLFSPPSVSKFISGGFGGLYNIEMSAQ